jgi:hypothetical protein
VRIGVDVDPHAIAQPGTDGSLAKSAGGHGESADLSVSTATAASTVPAAHGEAARDTGSAGGEPAPMRHCATESAAAAECSAAK